MARAIQGTVAEIGEVVQREGIQCDWRQGGTLKVAQNKTQLGRLRESVAGEHHEIGDDAAWRLLTADELRARVVIDGALGAIYNPYCARAQPARLALGLADAAERRGATIHEASAVRAISPGAAHTDEGEVRARYVIRATEGYTANLPGHHRTLLPLNSAMIVTEPIADADWQQLGWAGAETLLDGSNAYTYSQRTAEGRIAIGGRGVPYRFGSRTDREGPVPESTVHELRERLSSLFPSLSDVPVARAWHGVLGVSRDWCPTVGLDPKTGMGYAGGYAGEGVAASNLAARTLRDLVLGHDSELTRLPWVGTPARDWEPEPLRFLGARTIYSLYRLADRSELARDRPSLLARIADRISGRASLTA
jgi:glycine/D-amino acid oxidase-like deaminating enzyme